MSLDLEKTELKKLHEFAAALSPDSFIRGKLTDVAAQASERIRQMELRATANMLTLKVKVDKSTLIMNNMPDTLSLTSLKYQIIDTMGDECSWLHRATPIQICRLGGEVIFEESGLETTSQTLQQSGLQDGDLLFVQPMSTKTGARSVAVTGALARSSPLQDMEIEGTRVDESPVAAVGAALHLFMTGARGFVCLVESGGRQVPGFAPSLRELPKGKALPDGWDQDPSRLCFTYKHPTRPGAQFRLLVESAGSASERVEVVFSKKNTVPTSDNRLEVPLANHTVLLTGGRAQVRDESVLYHEVEPLVLRLVPGAKPVQTKPSVVAQSQETRSGFVPSTELFGTVRGPMVPKPAVPSTDDRGYSSFVPTAGTNPDLEPGLNHGVPTGLFMRGPGESHRPGPGGMLVGPDSDIFNGGGPEYPTAPGFEFEDPNHPGVRFDPLLPPEIGKPMRSRSRSRSSESRPRGAPRLPGEPDPDHIKPPGW